MTRLAHTTRSATALLLIAGLASACSGDGNMTTPDGPAPTPDAPTNSGKTYRQVEHLARPGINEALLISEGFLAGYNATAPSFKGVDPTTLNMVVGEAKTVLKALYLGACLLNGALGLTPATGVKPAGIPCHAVGPAIWVGGQLNGTVLTPESKTAAQTYADKVFDQFIPDVLRIDTGVATSTYLSLCGDATSKPLLCGGRFVNNDVIDITYDYLLAGAAITKGAFDQVHALVSDGVSFSLDDAQNVGNVVTPVANPQQGHPAISNTFPYSAPPL
ncbi:MAG TPA: DUF4331 family protein [Kofleriaceae bacterium]|nr:DUF4331 family protein [Kofleriaceae bacterium]